VPPAPSPEPATELIHFEDEAGVFSVDHPAAFSQVEASSLVGGYGYNFFSPDGEGSMFVAFAPAYEAAMTDEDWQSQVDAYAAAILTMLAQGGDFEFEELDREVGEAGDHSIYLEAESTNGKLRLAFETQESEGVLALVIFLLPADQWDSLQQMVVDSLESFSWSPQVTRDQMNQETVQETPAGDLVAFVDPDGVFAIKYPASFDNSQGPGFRDQSYTFSVWPSDRTKYISIFFDVLAEEGFTDEEWEEKTDSIIAAGFQIFGEDTVELSRVQGESGEHWIVLQFESESKGTRGLYLVEEVDGTLAMVLAESPSSEWSTWQGSMTAAFESFTWSADALRETIEADEATE
jgi:hypothetical protein